MEWVLFNIAIIGFLAIDLFMHKNNKKIAFKEAITWSVVWICIALLFGFFIYFDRGQKSALEFYTGYLLEKALSVDNLFVFMLIFSYFKTPREYLHKVLFWGVFGAILMRAAFIFAGIALIEQFHAVLYLFGAFLVYAGFKMALDSEPQVEIEHNPVYRFFARFFPIQHQYEGSKFFVKKVTGWVATPLAATLLAVETTDLVFAVDSIPAVMSITLDPFIIYTSNILAILGLRSLYFALEGCLDTFRFLHYGLGAILAFVGLKMILSDIYKIPLGASLGFIALAIAVSIASSLLIKDEKSH
jgi:tellurite resistance protein TerC